mmetsp:Transcript_32659/g.50841  ORF Transcript_32659/g.50841 Transcript_32659/m.50841 type:complete len:102 (+) Transcript_32659:129-434(+)
MAEDGGMESEELRGQGAEVTTSFATEGAGSRVVEELDAGEQRSLGAEELKYSETQKQILFELWALQVLSSQDSCPLATNLSPTSTSFDHAVLHPLSPVALC